MADRVVLFIDYQNVYRRARELFFDHATDRHWCGQISPLKLGTLLVDRSPFDRVLHQVRVYRGLPGASQDPKAYAAARKQMSDWELDHRVKVIQRPLRYPHGWPNNHASGARPGEKGIDVALAIDFAAMAVPSEYEAGILFSVDTDLKPALEFVSDPSMRARSEVAAWRDPVDYPRRLSLGSNKPYCHWLNEQDYNRVCDHVDYNC